MDKPIREHSTLVQVFAASQVTDGHVRIFWRNYIKGQRRIKVHALDVALPVAHAHDLWHKTPGAKGQGETVVGPR